MQMECWIKLLLLEFLLVRLAAGQECPGTVGRTNNDPREAIRNENRFYINKGDPATCNGAITSFSYCYYRPQDFNAVEYAATFAVYRPQGDQAYSAVSPTLTIRLAQNQLSSDNFVCSDFLLNQTVTIEVGDVLGACVADPPGSIGRLDLIGRDGTMSRLIRTEEVLSTCAELSVPGNIDLEIIDGAEINSRRTLYLSATIATPESTIPTMDTTANFTAMTIGTDPLTGQTTDEINTATGNDQTTENVETTTDNVSDGRRSNPDPITIAVPVVVLIVVIALAVILVVIIALFTKKQKRAKQSSEDSDVYYSVPNSSQSGQARKIPSETQQSVELGSNAAYDTRNEVTIGSAQATEDQTKNFELKTNEAYGTARLENSVTQLDSTKDTYDTVM